MLFSIFSAPFDKMITLPAPIAKFTQNLFKIYAIFFQPIRYDIESLIWQSNRDNPVLLCRPRNNIENQISHNIPALFFFSYQFSNLSFLPAVRTSFNPSGVCPRFSSLAFLLGASRMRDCMFLMLACLQLVPGVCFLSFLPGICSLACLPGVSFKYVASQLTIPVLRG